MRNSKWFPFLLVFICTILISIAQVFYKTGVTYLELSFIGLITNWHIISGLALYGVGALFLIYALKRGDVTFLYPLVALGYVWVSLLSVYFFGETMNLIKWAGVLVIVVGISFIGYGGSSDVSLKYSGGVE